MGCFSSTSLGGWGPSSSRVTLTLRTSRVRAPPYGSPALTGGLRPFLFRFLEFFGFAAFDVAFIFMMPPLAAKTARYRAAELGLVLYLLTIFSFLRALQLEHARTSPITVGRVAGSTFIICRTTVEKIGGPFIFEGGGLSHVLQLPPTALPRVRVGLRRPPSRRLLIRGLPSQTCACGSHSPSPRLTRSTDGPGHGKRASELSSRTSLCSHPMSS